MLKSSSFALKSSSDSEFTRLSGYLVPRLFPLCSSRKEPGYEVGFGREFLSLIVLGKKCEFQNIFIKLRYRYLKECHVCVFHYASLSNL
jgi:hypothetical protein